MQPKYAVKKNNDGFRTHGENSIEDLNKGQTFDMVLHPVEQQISESYKTFDMVSKLLQNGSTTKRFFQRYGNSKIIVNETQV